MTWFPLEARAWTLRDLRRAVAAGWAPGWVLDGGNRWREIAGGSKALIRGGYLWPRSRQPRPQRSGSRRHVWRYPLMPEAGLTLARAIDQRIALLGAHAPAWWALEPDKAQDTTPEPNQPAGPGEGSGQPHEGAEGEAHEELSEAPRAGGTARPDETAQEAELPAEIDPAPREGGEPMERSMGKRCAQGSGTATSGEMDEEGAGRAKPTSSDARGGTEADPRGAPPADDSHDDAQETSGTAGPATARRVETRRRVMTAGSSRGTVPFPAQPPRDRERRAEDHEGLGELAHEGEVVSLFAAAGAADQDLLEQPAQAPGWVAARLAQVAPEEVARERRHAERLQRALERWLRHLDQGAAGSPSPRLDGERLVRELVARRYALQRTRRWERELGTVLVLVDVSGSCAAAAPSTLAATMAFAEAHPGRVAVVIHSNGFPQELAGVAAAWEGKLPELRPGRPAWERLGAWMTGQLPNLAGLLVFGDWHAGDLIQACAQRAPTIWLDDYAARSGVRPASKNLRRAWIAPRQPVVWWQGVQTAQAAADAVQAACGGQR